VKVVGAPALASKERFDPGDTVQVDRAAAALLERFYRENDTAAFELLVEISQPLLDEAARAITRDVGLAVPPGELVAEYFSKLFVDLRQPTPRVESLIAAATASMKDEATRRVRTMARRIRPIEEPDAAGATLGGPADAPAGAQANAGAASDGLSADQRLAGRFAALVSMCFHNLDESDRRLLLALEIDRLSYSEIGERFGIYQDEVADKIMRARGRLAARIAAVFAALQPEEGER
jgi:RNA polymerase sigma factor (sigma-70 family)